MSGRKIKFSREEVYNGPPASPCLEKKPVKPSPEQETIAPPMVFEPDEPKPLPALQEINADSGGPTGEQETAGFGASVRYATDVFLVRFSIAETGVSRSETRVVHTT